MMPGVVSVVLQVTGALWWGGIILLALFIAVLQHIDKRRDRLGDDAIAMTRGWTDDDPWGDYYASLRDASGDGEQRG